MVNLKSLSTEEATRLLKAVEQKRPPGWKGLMAELKRPLCWRGYEAVKGHVKICVFEKEPFLIKKIQLELFFLFYFKHENFKKKQEFCSMNSLVASSVERLLSLTIRPFQLSGLFCLTAFYSLVASSVELPLKLGHKAFQLSGLFCLTAFYSQVASSVERLLSLTLRPI